MMSQDLDTAILEMTHSKELFQKNHEERMRMLNEAIKDINRADESIKTTRSDIAKLMEELDDI